MHACEGRSFLIAFSLVACASAVIFSAWPAAAQSAQLSIGTNLIGFPGISSADLSACSLRYYDSSTRPGCRYERAGHIVFYNSTNTSGDCGSGFFSSDAMGDGIGYYVSANQTCTVTFTPKTTMDVTLYPGSNLVSVPVQTTADQIAAACGGTKGSLLRYFDSSTRSGCKYDDAGYFVYFNTTNSSGDCGTNFHSSSVLMPYIGYYVSFNGFAGDGSTPCQLHIVNGVLQIPASPTTTSTTSHSTTTSTRASSTTTSAPATTTTATGNPTIRNIWKQGDTYYATGGHSSTSFPALWKQVHADLKAGDTVHFAGNTEYVANETIKLSQSGITITGDLGPDGRPTAFIRSYSSKQGVILFNCLGDVTTLRGVGFNGLGYVDNLDQKDPYDLVRFSGADNVVIENCTFEHFHQYLLELGDSDNFTIRYNTVRYGQNGISTYATNYGGVIEYNNISDCSQGAIKLRGGHGTTVRFNTIHLEYTYWRSFDHYGFPGTDGRGIELHDAYASSQGIYFGVTDPQPDVSVNVYSNTLIDVSVHGTVQVKDVVDGTLRKSPPESFGCRFPLDANTTSKSQNNQFHDNYVNGAYYGVWVEGYVGRSPQPITVYDNNTFVNILKNSCYIGSTIV